MNILLSLVTAVGLLGGVALAVQSARHTDRIVASLCD